MCFIKLLQPSQQFTSSTNNISHIHNVRWVWHVTSAMLIWMEAWSLAPMILLLAELQNTRCFTSPVLNVALSSITSRTTENTKKWSIFPDFPSHHSPFTWDVEVHKFSSVVLHVFGLYGRLQTWGKEIGALTDVKHVFHHSTDRLPTRLHPIREISKF